MRIKPYWQYFKYVLEHKKNVFIECWKEGLYVHAFTHDLSKFRPSEFIPYARYFYVDKEKYKNGFDKAWKLHYKRNKHHWNHWRNTKCMSLIPIKYIDQMICDWKAMSRKFGDTAQAYYLNNYNKIKLRRESRLMLELCLGINDSLIHNYGHTLKEFAEMQGEKLFDQYFSHLNEKYEVDTYSLVIKKQ